MHRLFKPDRILSLEAPVTILKSASLMIESPPLVFKPISAPVDPEDNAIVEEVESTPKQTSQPAVLEKEDTLISSNEMMGDIGPDAIRPQSTEPDWKPFDGMKYSTTSLS